MIRKKKSKRKMAIAGKAGRDNFVELSFGVGYGTGRRRGGAG